MKRLYLDIAAGASNPSSIHQEGGMARMALNKARTQVARLLSVKSDEVIFTSGGTESNNTVINSFTGGILISAIEHASIREPGLARQAVIVPVTKKGLLDLEQFKKLLTRETKLVSVIYASNELGTIQPLKEISKIIKAHRNKYKISTPYFHTDACQASRFLNLKVNDLGVDLMTLNTHKVGGPAGVGVLYVRHGTPLKPLLLGGGQEFGLRSGTENVSAIVAGVEALVKWNSKREIETKKLTLLRDKLIKSLIAIPGVMVNGDLVKRLPHNINVSVAGVSGEQLVVELDQKGIAISTGSACNNHGHFEGHVILALGGDREQAESTVRITLDTKTSTSDIDRVARVSALVVTKLRQQPKL
ncbi:MAG: cysteine desulfurase [Candidatus Vogelbacteria bacterium]|nr:cysteine desulfurase [Candidatus Vogelbacteria bacterium]